MNDIISPYNIGEPISLYAGSYRELLFEFQNDFDNSLIDLKAVPNIEFKMCLYGDYNDSALALSLKDNTEIKPYLIIDTGKPNYLTVILYADETDDFQDTLYDFQIIFHTYDMAESSIVGQGQIRVFSKIK